MRKAIHQGSKSINTARELEMGRVRQGHQRDWKVLWFRFIFRCFCTGNQAVTVGGGGGGAAGGALDWKVQITRPQCRAVQCNGTNQFTFQSAVWTRPGDKESKMTLWFTFSYYLQFLLEISILKSSNFQAFKFKVQIFWRPYLIVSSRPELFM